MKSPFGVLFFLMHFGTCIAQSYPFEDAAYLYSNYQDYLNQQKDTVLSLRVMQDVRVDSLSERFWFSERSKGMLKYPVVISIKGRTYFQEKAIRQSLPEAFHPHAKKETSFYYPVLESGRYLYFEILSETRNPDLGVAMGVMGGEVGKTFGQALTPAEVFTSVVVFDSQTQKFFAFDTWKELQVFLKAYHPAYQCGIPSPANFLSDTRRVFRELNNQ